MNPKQMLATGRQALKNRPFVQNIGRYVLITGITSGIPYLALPFITHAIAPEAYGTYGLFLTLSMMLTTLIGLGHPSQLNILASKMQDEQPQSRKDYAAALTAVLPLMGVAALLWAGLLSAFATPLYKLTGLPLLWLLILVATSLSMALITVLNNYLTYRNRVGRFAAVRIGQVSINYTLALVLVLGFGFSWQGLTGAVAIAVGLMALTGVGHFIRAGLLTCHWRWEPAREVLWLGLPTMLYTFSVSLITLADRFMVAGLTDLHQTGLYTLGTQVAAVVQVAVSSLIYAWWPWVYRELDGLERVRFTPRITKGLLAIGGLILLGGACFAVIAPFLIQWFLSPAYHGALPLMNWLVLAYVAAGLFSLVAGFLIYAKRVWTLLQGTLVCGTLNLALNYILILHYGPAGAAMATCISFLLAVAFVIWRVWLLSFEKQKFLDDSLSA